MATLLNVIEHVTKLLNLTVPTTVVGNSDAQVKQLLACANEGIRSMRMEYEWPQCNREHTFNQVASTASYALPGDFDYFISETVWDRTEYHELVGGLSPQEWQWEKSGLIATGIHTKFRVKGVSDAQFFLHPTPATGETNELVFEYQSRNCVRPMTWANSTTFAAGAYCFEDGTWYSTAAGGETSGTGVADDTGVTDWTAYTSSYEQFQADTDIPILCDRCLGLSIGWRFLERNGLNYQELQRHYNEELHKIKSNYIPAHSLSLTRTRGKVRVWPNIPLTGYGS